MPEITIHFQRPPDWVEPVMIHFWDRMPAKDATDWPGVPMMPVQEHPGWYCYRFDDTTRVHLVFNDGDGRQSRGPGPRARWLVRLRHALARYTAETRRRATRIDDRHGALRVRQVSDSVADSAGNPAACRCGTQGVNPPTTRSRRKR